MSGAHVYERPGTRTLWCSFTVGGVRHRRSTGKRDRGEAVAQAARLFWEAHQRAHLPVPPDAQRPNVEDACGLYLQDLSRRILRKELQRGPRYYADQEAALARVAARWRGRPLDEVGAGWKRALGDWHAEGASWRTLQVVTVATRHLLAWAHEAGHLDVELKLRAPSGEAVTVEATERRPFSAAERNAFLREVRKIDERAWRIYTVLFYTGARKSDLERLRLRQVDLGSGFVALPPRQTKSRLRDQVLYLPPKAIAALRAELRARKVVDPDALVFGPFNLRREFALACEAAKIRDRQGLVPHHVTRHTAATLAADAGASLAELMAFGRWTSPQMAARYMRVRAAQAKRAGDRL